MNRAVITGVGVVSPFGFGCHTLWDGLCAGASAVSPLQWTRGAAFPVHVAGQVPFVEPNKGEAALFLRQLGYADLERKAMSGGWFWRDRKAFLGVAAALEAFSSSRLHASSTSMALSLALGLEQAHLQDFAPLWRNGQIDWSQPNPRALLPETFRSPVDLCVDAIANVLPILGPRVVHTSACAAGTLAVAHAAAWIERGVAEVVLCGGADSMLNPLGMGGMFRLGAPSPRGTSDACKPFDRYRDGLAMGEGAALFIVESERHARARNALPLAVISGWGSTQDGYAATAPRADGSVAARAITAALHKARLSPGDLEYVNAHGTGTPLNDLAEARALHTALGDHAQGIRVSSIKGAVGHLMAAAGALELAACLMCFSKDVLPGTCNLRELDPACALNVIGAQALQARVNTVLSNSFGFGGQNASLIVQRYA